MSEQWYVYKDQKQQGPYSFKQLTEQINSGEVTPEDLVWKEGMADWVKAELVEGLIPKKASAPLPSGTAPVKPKKKKSAFKIAAIIGGSVVVLLIVIIMLVMSGVRSMLRSSEVYAQAMSVLQADYQAAALLGEPITAGKSVSGEINVSNGSGSARLTIPVSGSIDNGKLDVDSTRIQGQWSINTLELIMSSGEKIDLMETADPGMLLFNEPGYGFTMQYPEDWSYEIGDGTIVFKTPQGTDEEDFRITVQFLFSSALGGSYASIDEVLEALATLYLDLDGVVVSIDQGFDIYNGIERPYGTIAALYESDRILYAEISLIIDRDGDYFYIIMLTYPDHASDASDNFMPTFLKMIESFKIVSLGST